MVLVLIVFSSLSLLAFGLCHRVRLELKVVRMRGDDLASYYLALGGLNRAMAALQQQGGEKEDNKLVHFGQPWHLNTTSAQEGFFQDTRWASCSLSYATSDEESRLNINTSSPVGWVNLPGVTESIVRSILDWQDADDSPSPGGVESAEYLRRTPAYKAKNAPTTMVWELAYVNGVDSGLLLGEDVNGNQLLDEAENDGPATPPMDNADGVLDAGLVDHFTVYGKGKVNLNTASAEVLAGLPGMDLNVARNIVTFRSGSDNQPFTSDDRFFKAFGDLAEIPGVTELQLELLKQYGGFKTDHFRIVSEASIRPSGRPCRLVGTVRRTDEGVQLVLLRQG